MDKELSDALDQKFSMLVTQIENKSLTREKGYTQKTHDLERATDALKADNEDILKRTEKLFSYIDELRKVGTVLEGAVQKLASIADSTVDQEARIRNIEKNCGTCATLFDKNEDQEKRIRSLEKSMAKFIGGLKLWGGLMAGCTILISLAALVVSILK